MAQFIEKEVLAGATIDSVGLPSIGTLTLTGAIVPGVHAESVLTSNGTAPSDGETVTIGATVYTFKTALTPTAFEVLIGASAAEALDNLKSAINAGAGAGTTYATGTTAHPDVVATDNADTTQKVVAREPGTANNDDDTLEDSATLSWADTTLGGGTGASNPGVAVETVTIGDVTYSFVDVLSETNAPADAIPNQVLFGADSAAALDNLKLAINKGATEGTNYSTGTVAHPLVEATTNTDTAQTVESILFAEANDLIATTSDLANGAWGAETLEGGEDSTEQNAVVNVEGYSKIGVQVKAEDITSGNGVFTVEGTLNGTDWVALSTLVDNAANDNTETTARVASKTLSTNTTALLWIVDNPLKAVRVKVDVTTDGTYGAYVIATI
jgi:hypothetical protein